MASTKAFALPKAEKQTSIEQRLV